MKSNVEIEVLWSTRGSLEVSGNNSIRLSSYEFLLAFLPLQLYPCPASFLRYSEILVENHDFNLPHLHLEPLLGVAPFKFYQGHWHQKTRLPGYCMALFA